MRQPKNKRSVRRNTSTCCCLIVMAKEPIAGRVKTRLAREIGNVGATWFYRHLTSAVLRRLSMTQSWKTLLAVSPDTATNASATTWPASIARIAQGNGDLGERMQRLLERPHAAKTVIVGTDIPALYASHIRRAFAQLGEPGGAVLGPTPDGGYYLIGARRTPRLPRPFANVRWSSAHAYDDTARNLAPRKVPAFETLQDVDTADDWLKVRGWAGRVVLPIACRLPGR